MRKYIRSIFSPSFLNQWVNPCLPGLLGAALVIFLCFGFTQVSKKSSVYTVDLKKVTRAYVNTFEEDDRKANKQARLFWHRLYDHLEHLAEKKHAVILTLPAVITGAKDITPAVLDWIKREAKND